MACVLRVSAPTLPNVLKRISLTPYRVENGTAHFSVSDADSDDLRGQVQDALRFLTAHRAPLSALMATPHASGELDFATEYEPGAFLSRTVPASLTRLVGELGLDITISGYPRADQR